jgi:hypothetical protein
MNKILNTWKSTPEKKVFYEVGEPIYTNGDWSAYSSIQGGVLYAYKNIAINNLTGLNKEHIDRLANRKRPQGGYSPSHFIFNRAQESLKAGLALI